MVYFLKINPNPREVQCRFKMDCPVTEFPHVTNLKRSKKIEFPERIVGVVKGGRLITKMNILVGCYGLLCGSMSSTSRVYPVSE